MRKQALFTVVGIGVVCASVAIAQQGTPSEKYGKQAEKHLKQAEKQAEKYAKQAEKHLKQAEQPAFEMPEWMTPEMMQQCAVAATPNEMHAWLTEGVGTWHGKSQMWMEPGAEPIKTTYNSTVTSIMDGRFTTVNVTGEFPGMGQYNGFGLYGFDNTSKEFQATWCDNFGTGMMTGTGQLSSDKKELTFNFECNCPMSGGLKTFREIQRRTGKDSMVLEMYTAPPNGGDEYMMMEIKMHRTARTAAVDK